MMTTNRVPQIGTFFDTRNLNILWDFVAVLLKYVAPGVMIFVGIFCVGMVINLAIKAFKKADDDDDYDNKRRKDDDEYDMKYY